MQRGHGHGGHPGGHGGEGRPGKPVPRIISWNTTFKCNLRCAHCYMDAQERESQDELTTEEGKMLIDQIVEVSKPILVLSGGEPLLREDIFELAKYASDKGLSALQPPARLNDSTYLRAWQLGVVEASSRSLLRLFVEDHQEAEADAEE